MRSTLADLLVDPEDFSSLSLEAANWIHGEVDSAVLRSPRRTYEVRSGIPRFVTAYDESRAQTAESFAYKWSRRRSYGSPAMVVQSRNWLLERYGFSDSTSMCDFFERHERMLDLGCGSGFSSSLWMENNWTGDLTWIGVDISAAVDIAQEMLGSRPNTHFVQADALKLPFPPSTFDVIFSEGVFHHTPSTEAAIASAARALAPGGDLLFYTYRKKGPVREFTDDHVRSLIQDLPPAEAWETLRPLTRLAQSLAEMAATVHVREDVPLLGIRAGSYDAQRLIYWNFAKLYWNDQLSFEENHHVNFDWYHPREARRHTEKELRNWCDENRLSIWRLNAQDSGFTICATKSST